jgi:putative oxidoreductase
MSLYDAIVGWVERITRGWFFGLFARFTFASVLYFYFLNSAKTKIGDGVLGFFSVSDNAYYQIALPAVEAAGGDVSQVAFFPWGLMVYAGTYAEFALPLLIIVGLFTRIAAVGMIAFVAVQSWVDIYVHQVDARTIGAMFDRFSDGLIADQRLLWLFVLAYLAVRGAGAVSLDRLLVNRRKGEAELSRAPGGFAIS